MVYMGTATHDADFALILPALDRLAAEMHGRFDLTLIGAVRRRAQATVAETPAAAGRRNGLSALRSLADARRAI